MSLWIFQSLLNLFMVNVALLWIISRKRLKFLEAQVDRLELELDAIKLKTRSGSELKTLSAPTASNPVADFGQSRQPKAHPLLTSFPLEQSERTEHSTSLVEKTPTQSLLKSNPAEAFDRGSQMLAQGKNVKEISRVTGLSLAELQLMNKFVSRNQ